MIKRTAENKALAEHNALSRAWRKQQRERREALLAGQYCADVQALSDFLKTLTISSAAKLIEVVRAGPWREAGPDMCAEILNLVDDAITRLRQQHDLVPFDDPVPFSQKPLNAFLHIRSILTPSPAHARQLSTSAVATSERTGRDVTAAVQE